VVRRVDALARRAAEAKRGELGSMAIGFGLPSIDLAPLAVAAFRQHYPGVQVTLEDMSSSAQADAVLAGGLDVGFVRLPVAAELGQLALRTDGLALAVPRGAGTPPDDAAAAGRWLRDRPVVQLAAAKGPGLVKQIERFYEDFDTRPRIVQRTHDLQTVIALVASGVGAALVPASAAHIASSSVLLVPIRSTAVEWEIGVIWNREHVSHVSRNFLRILRRSAGH
jgi:DNA-binding transcriptional LysR family regulator